MNIYFTKCTERLGHGPAFQDEKVPFYPKQNVQKLFFFPSRWQSVKNRLHHCWSDGKFCFLYIGENEESRIQEAARVNPLKKERWKTVDDTHTVCEMENMRTKQPNTHNAYLAVFCWTTWLLFLCVWQCRGLRIPQECGEMINVSLRNQRRMELDCSVI